MENDQNTPWGIAEQIINRLGVGCETVIIINQHSHFTKAEMVFDAKTLNHFKVFGKILQNEYRHLMPALNAFYQLPPHDKQRVENAVMVTGAGNQLMQNTCHVLLNRGNIEPLTAWLYLMSFCEQAELGENCETIQERAIPRSSKLAHDLLGCGHITIAIEADQNGKFTLHYQPESAAANPIPASLFNITLVQNKAELTNIGRKTFVKLASDAPLREVLSELAAHQRQGKGLGGMTFCN